MQFAIQPVLDSIAVTAPQASLAEGSGEQLTATGTTPTGDDLAALQVPIADPVAPVVEQQPARRHGRPVDRAGVRALGGNHDDQRAPRRRDRHRPGDRHPVAG
jgi:hypothetical protein